VAFLWEDGKISTTFRTQSLDIKKVQFQSKRLIIKLGNETLRIERSMDLRQGLAELIYPDEIHYDCDVARKVSGAVFFLYRIYRLL
jgi:hypothetical protein